MIVSIFQVIKNLNYPIFVAASGTYIDVQPTITMSKSISHVLVDDIELASSLTGVENKNIHFALEFSIKRNLFINNYSIVAANRLRFGEISITLKRYKRKLSSEEYIEPEEVLLPDGIREINGFKMITTLVSNREDKHRLKKGCQLVSLFHHSFLSKDTISSVTIKNIIEKFKDLMGISSENTKDYGFKFTLRLQDSNRSHGVSMHVIQTHMFRIIFNEDEPFIELKEVDEYHLEK